MNAIATSGIRCPDCGGPSSVYRTTRGRRHVVRERRCKTCNRRWNTTEHVPLALSLRSHQDTGPMHDSPQTDVDPIALEAQAASHLAGAWEYCGLPVPDDYPVGTEAVIKLTAGLGYRIDHDFLMGLIDGGRLPIAQTDGVPLWSAVNVYQLHCELEARRRWTLHPRHFHKLTAYELKQLEAEAAGLETCFHDADEFDTESILLLMEELESKEMRHLFRVALMARLRSQGAL